MPYANHDGVRIHYHLAGNPDGPPLVLQHGFSGSLADWGRYVPALGEDYRLILLDARGHGLSDKPHDPDAYQPTRQAADVAAVLDDLGLARAHFLGYSMGGQIGFAFGIHAAARCASLLLGGDGATGRDPGNHATRQILDTLRRGIDAWAGHWGPAANPQWVERQRRNDAEALLACYTQLTQRPGFADALPQVAVPALIYAGDGDEEHAGAARAARLMPQARFVSLPGLNHGQGFTQVDVVLPQVRAFLADAGNRLPV